MSKDRESKEGLLVDKEEHECSLTGSEKQRERPKPVKTEMTTNLSSIRLKGVVRCYLAIPV